MKKSILLCLSVSILVGCAGADSINKKTAFHLGLEASGTEVFNMERGLYDITYNFKTKSGKVYNCQIYGGNPFSLGVVISPSCAERANAISNCNNPILKSAGRCK